MKAVIFDTWANSVSILVVLCLTSPAWSENFFHDQEKCTLHDQTIGVCKAYSKCPSAAASTSSGTPPVICHSQGDVTYICCESTENDRKSQNYARGEEEGNGDPTSEYDIEDRHFWNMGNRRNGGRGRENYLNYENGRYQNLVQDGRRRVGGNNHYDGGRRQSWTHNGHEIDIFYNSNYNWAPSVPTEEHSYFFEGINNNNNNNKWQGNQKYPTNNNRRTTERPRTTYRPPQSSSYGGNRKRISEIKCDEYSKPVREMISVLPLGIDSKPINVSVQKCISAQKLIVGGENTTSGEFPHMAAIGFLNKMRQIEWICGGSLISEQYVLTAAHCTSTSRKPVKVRLGEYNLKKNDDGAYPEDYVIVDIINHPDYRPPSKYNDIALLKLSRSVNIRKNIRPACLNTKNTIPDSKVIAIGWGRTGRVQATSDVLLKVALSLIPKSTCSRSYENSRQGYLPQGIIDSQICAGELSGGKDTCQGDSGGPIEFLSQSNQCIHYIVGITSFGRHCAQPNSPGVYTRVSSYIPWIERIVWPEQ